MMMKLALVAGIAMVAVSCGGGGNTYGDDEPTPAQPDTAFDAVKPLIAKNCGGCHNGTTQPLKFDSGAKFKGSKAKAKLTNSLMPPPPKTISDEDKQALLAYLGG